MSQPPSANTTGAAAQAPDAARPPSTPGCFLCGQSDYWALDKFGVIVTIRCKAHQDKKDPGNVQIFQERWLSFLKTHPEDRQLFETLLGRAPQARIDFGTTHKGKLWTDPSVPDHFLDWIVDKSKHGRVVKHRAAEELRRRGVSVEQFDVSENAETDNPHAGATRPPATEPHDAASLTAASTTPMTAIPGPDHGVRPLLDMGDLASLLKVSRKTISRMRKAGKLPRENTNLGRHKERWLASVIEEWMEAGMPCCVS